MKFLKNNILLILIIILSIFLRINYDTFLEGYNFDEIAMVSIAKLNFPFEILKYSAIEDYHAPLYYLIIHPFCNIENAYIPLRLLNTIFSIINLFVFYQIGKLILNKKTGLILALLLAINHQHIAMANFIKFYCLCFLLCSAIFYYFIKVIKKNDGYNKLALFNSLFILSSTFGVLFVILEYLILFLIKQKACLKSFLLSLIGFVLYLPILSIQAKTALSNIINPHGAYPSFSIFGTYIFLNDWFSPLLNYSCNTQTVESMPLVVDNIKKMLSNQPLDYISLISFILLSFIPVIISLYFIYKGIKENKDSKKLFLLGLSYFLCFSILILLEISGYIPLYIYPFGLILIILIGIGYNYSPNKFLIAYLCIAQLIVTNVYPAQAREEKEKIYGKLDYAIEKIDNKTTIILIDAGRFLKHYYKDKKIFALDYEQIEGGHDKKLFEIYFGEEIAKKANKHNIKALVKPIILSNKKSQNFENYLQKELFSNIKKDEKLILIFNSDSRFFTYTQKEIENLLDEEYSPHLINSSLTYQIKNNKEELSQSTLGEIIQSNITKNFVGEIEKEFKKIKIEQFIKNINDKYQKVYESDKNLPDIQWIMENPTAGWIFVTYQKK